MARSGRANWRKSKLAEERIGGLGGKQECGRRGQPTIRLIRRPPSLRSQLPARRPSVNPLNLRELHIRESFIYKALQHPFNPQAAWPPKSATCASAIRKSVVSARASYINESFIYKGDKQDGEKKSSPWLGSVKGLWFGAVTYSPTFAVPSARRGLTSLFGMGRGGAPVLWPPYFSVDVRGIGLCGARLRLPRLCVIR